MGPVGNPEEEGEGEEKVEGVDVVEVSTVAVATEPFLLLWASDGFLPGGTDFPTCVCLPFVRRRPARRGGLVFRPSTWFRPVADSVPLSPECGRRPDMATMDQAPWPEEAVAARHMPAQLCLGNISAGLELLELGRR